MEPILFIAGTRPEAIKLVPVYKALQKRGARVQWLSTGQHRELSKQALDVFGIVPDVELDVMSAGQGVAQLMGRLMAEIPAVLEEARPAAVLVQGDTATAVAGALCAFYCRVPVGHVEAGLRTFNLDSPFPEEGNRQLISRVARWHFAPTVTAAANLMKEGFRGKWFTESSRSIVVTGNTVVDAVLATKGREPELAGAEGKRVITVTCHRRENIGSGADEIASACVQIAGEFEGVHLVVVVHPNPKVAEPMRARMGGVEGITIVDPLGYEEFVGLLRRSWLLITDSGGLQEEGVSLGVPVLITRDRTERQEAVEAGAALLTGAKADAIRGAVAGLLQDEEAYRRMKNVENPFGDGRAGEMIAKVLMQDLRAVKGEM